ncbi:MAG: hypothetical protein IKQ46_06470 [Bacteroidales bacterium]|nr:hypothetical protein [Bacteroidales bacterium]
MIVLKKITLILFAAFFGACCDKNDSDFYEIRTTPLIDYALKQYYIDTYLDADTIDLYQYVSQNGTEPVIQVIVRGMMYDYKGRGAERCSSELFCKHNGNNSTKFKAIAKQIGDTCYNKK